MNNRMKVILTLCTVLAMVTLYLIGSDEYEVLQCNNECMCVIKYKEEDQSATVIYYDNVLGQETVEEVHISELDNTVGDMMTYCNNHH